MKTVKYQILHIFPAFFLAAVLSACSWLDVGSKSEIDGDEMFLSTEGYYTAITGVYINMGSTELYGGNLPLSALEPLTQQYTQPDDDTDRTKWGQYNYTTDGAKTIIDDVWGTMYNTIVNCNLLIENLEREDCPVFDAGVWEILTGEAIGLRAYMFFDLIRLYNEAYCVKPECKNVPLKKDFGFNLGEQATTRQALDYLVGELNRAQKLLRENDPIVSGKSYSDKYVNYDRRYRMNYYAVTALLARIELYRGEYAAAYGYAEEVIGNSDFRFIEADEIIETDAYGKEQKIDRLFMPEMIFALGNENILTTSRSDYESLGGDFIKSAACYDENDVRRNWIYTNPSANNKINLIRYQRSTLAEDAYLYDIPAVPLLKLGEMYLIAAEAVLNNPSAGDKNPGEWINTLKGHRNTSLLPDGADNNAIETQITREYIGEFKGEGQLFFYYKRRNMSAIDDGYYTGNTVKMNSSYYTWPLPEYEQDFGHGTGK